MEKGKKERIDEWLKLNETIADMYFKIAYHEMENKIDDEYRELRYLLPKTVQIENKRRKELDLKTTEMGYLNYLCPMTDEEELQIECGRIPNYVKLRKSNRIKDYSLFTLGYSGEAKKQEENPIRTQAHSIATAIVESIFGPCEVIDETPQNDLAIEQFNRALNVRVRANQLSIIERILRDDKNHKMRDYLIYLKYLLISSNDYCEKLWIDSPSSIIPTASVLDDFPEIARGDKRTIYNQTRMDLKEDVTAIIQRIGDIDDFSIKTVTAEFYDYLTLIEAELISLKDINYLYELARAMQPYVKDGMFYTGINKYLSDILEDAKALIKRPEETNKEGN